MPKVQTEFTFRSEPVPWNIGEHIAVIGDTGTGKTYLMSKLADMREHVVALRTKPDNIKFQDMMRVSSTARMGHLYDTRLLVTPKFHEQAYVGATMIDKAWKQGGWTVILDELFYITNNLRLNLFVEMLLTQGRSKRISVLTGMQRPVHVTRFALSQATHIFSFSLENKDAKFVSEATSENMLPVLLKLDRNQFQFAHFHRLTRSIAVGNANDLTKILRNPITNAARK